MAAFCTCCGSVITAKVEKCLMCGAPRHGMTAVPPDGIPFDKEAADEQKSDNTQEVA